MRHTALPIAILLFFVACTEADNGDGNSQAQQQTENQTSDEIFPPPEGTPDGDGPAGGAAQPAWSAPPKNEVGVAVGFDPIVFLGDKAAVALQALPSTAPEYKCMRPRSLILTRQAMNWGRPATRWDEGRPQTLTATGCQTICSG